MRKSVLFATDFSTASRPALDQAVAIARSGKSPLLIVHALVTPSPVTLEGAAFPQAYEELEAEIRADAVRRLKGLVKVAKKKGVAATALLVRGIPHQEILKVARKRRAAMIVVGTHGRTGLSRLVVGSVAARLVAASSCPVLTVRKR
ncbi:MAG TPA: universal stress protein [Thermoanaerobaculia bacterium]